MIILGIETSCDETGAALVENGTTILSNVVASSRDLHIKTGGIIPEMAAREQIKCMIPVIEEALKTGCGWVVGYEKPIPITHSRLKTQNSSPPIDAIAVTVGPGLIGSLLVGVETAKTLAYAWNKPIIPVNHLLAHVYANWLSSRRSDSPTSPFSPNAVIPQFPLVALIVSGGHTELILMRNHGSYEWLGGTRDDAAGEAFDKIARLLELGYPGGPAVAASAAKFKVTSSKFKVKLPRPMIDSHDYDFSFSGLKTAVLREVSHLSNLPNLANLLAYETQEAITDVLVKKAVRAAQQENVNQILLAGGVSANQRLREKILKKCETEKITSFCSAINLFLPEPKLATDNAAAIASCAFFNQNFLPWPKISADPSLSL